MSLLLILISSNINAQVVDTSKVLVKGYYFSGGANTIQYVNTTYYDNIAEDFKFDVSNDYFYNAKGNKSMNGNTSPLLYNSPKISIGPSINLGLELFDEDYKNLRHVIDIGFMRFGGNFSSAYNFHANGMIYMATSWNANFSDTINYSFTHTAIKLGYKFQPHFDPIFLSIGINFCLNFIDEHAERKEYVIGSAYDAETGKGGIINEHFVNDASEKSFYMNLPLEVGIGGNIKHNKLELKPAFYYSPWFMKGFNLYTVSVSIMYFKH
ncbi:MAG: hypothetical protein WCL14_09915 [Bacteroidota bacterium]